LNELEKRMHPTITYLCAPACRVLEFEPSRFVPETKQTIDQSFDSKTQTVPVGTPPSAPAAEQ
jgi:hypothetical protein